MRLRYGSQRNIRFLSCLVLITVTFVHINQVYWNSETLLNKSRMQKRQLFVNQERIHRNSNESQKRLYSYKQSYAKCNPGKGLVFLKTHKTASTTVTNILLRYAEKHRLVVGLPPEKRWELAGYPSKFDRRIIDPQVQKYDVLCHHFRYSHDEIRQVMRTGSKTVTILRDPVQHYESGFAFFRSWPYSEWFANVSRAENLREFLDNPEIYYNKSTPWYFIAKNYMAFDLGFDNDKDTLSYVESAIRQTELWFDLVMITERIDESLILLKDLLCIESLEEIIYLRLKVRQDSARRHLTGEMKNQIRSWNFLDSKLYEHFNRTLDHKIASYGNARMKKDVREFQNLLKKTEERCIVKYDQLDLKPWVSKIKLNIEEQKYCSKFTWGEVKFGDYIRDKQRSYSSSFSSGINNKQLESLLEEAQRKVVGEEGLKP